MRTRRWIIMLGVLVALLVLCNGILYGNSRPSDEAIEKAKRYAKENNMRTDIVVLCDFSLHSGKPRFWIYDCVNDKVLYRTLCSHGCGKGNRAWRAKISNAPGSNCSSVGMFRVMGFHKMRGKYPSLKLKGLSETNSNAERRGILIHSGVSSSLFKYGMFPFYIPLTIESQGCFAINNKIFQRLLDLSDDKQQKLLLYAYM